MFTSIEAVCVAVESVVGWAVGIISNSLNQFTVRYTAITVRTMVYKSVFISYTYVRFNE